MWKVRRRFDKSSAKYHFPVPEEKRKARIDVYQLVGTCSVQVDPEPSFNLFQEGIQRKSQ